GALVLTATLAYGWRQLSASAGASDSRTLRVALIQGSIDTKFDEDRTPGEKIFERYAELSRAAAAHSPKPDLIVWPESMFTGDSHFISYDDNAQAPPRPDDLPAGRYWPSDAEFRDFLYQYT